MQSVQERNLVYHKLEGKVSDLFPLSVMKWPRAASCLLALFKPFMLLNLSVSSSILVTHTFQHQSSWRWRVPATQSHCLFKFLLIHGFLDLLSLMTKHKRAPSPFMSESAMSSFLPLWQASGSAWGGLWHACCPVCLAGKWWLGFCDTVHS